MKNINKVILAEVVEMITSKVNISSLTQENYISTECMLPDRGGVVPIDNLPKQGRVNAFNKGDVLFSNIRTYFKKVWLAHYSGGASNDVIVFRPLNKNILDNVYLYYLLSSDDFISSTIIASKGTKMPRGDKDAMLRYSFILPPLEIQHEIALILNLYDKLIENNKRRIKFLEEMARSIYREWFVNFRYPGHEKDRRVPSPLGEIPDGWEVKNLESLITDHIGGGWGKDNSMEGFSEPAWVIRGTDIPDARVSQVTTVPHRFHSPSNLRSRILKSGDIVFEVSGGSKGQPVGRTLLISSELLSRFDGDAICASFCKRVRPNNHEYGSELLYLSFLEGYESGEMEQYQVQSTGITNYKWTEYISMTKRVVPSELVLKQFEGFVKPILRHITILGIQMQNLRQTRDLLLQRLISGNKAA